MNECSPLNGGGQGRVHKPGEEYTLGRGLHSFLSQLNMSAFYVIGGARRGCVARAKGV